MCFIGPQIRRFRLKRVGFFSSKIRERGCFSILGTSMVYTLWSGVGSGPHSLGFRFARASLHEYVVWGYLLTNQSSSFGIHQLSVPKTWHQGCLVTIITATLATLTQFYVPIRDLFWNESRKPINYSSTRWSGSRLFTAWLLRPVDMRGASITRRKDG